MIFHNIFIIGASCQRCHTQNIFKFAETSYNLSLDHFLTISQGYGGSEKILNFRGLQSHPGVGYLCMYPFQVKGCLCSAVSTFIARYPNIARGPVKIQTSVNYSIPCINKSDGTATTTDYETSCDFHRYFSAVYIQGDNVFSLTSVAILTLNKQSLPQE